MSAFIGGWRRCGTFTGRTRRSEYWIFTLVNILVEIGLFAATAGSAAALDGRFTAVPATLEFLFLGYVLVSQLPALAIAVRRLHDTGYSGFYYLIQLIPVIGGLMLLVQLRTDGTPGPNRYGPDPKSREPYLGPPVPAYGMGFAGRMAVRAGIVVAIIVTCSAGGAIALHFAPDPGDDTPSGPMHSGGANGAAAITGTVPAGSKRSTTPVRVNADLLRVCDGWYYPAAPTFTGLSPHPALIGVRDRTFGDDRLVRPKLHLPYPATKPLKEAWYPTDPTTVQVVACVDQVGSGGARLTDCAVSEPSPQAVPMKAADYQVTVYEVATRRRLAQEKLSGAEQSCGLLVVVGSDGVAYADLSDDQLIGLLAKYIEE
ncbi:DUF805 domain-containing protein [Paractinoplanes durhamensis]|nr:DUF805 domain-containing protein [Actinoplanes durhamensis]